MQAWWLRFGLVAGVGLTAVGVFEPGGWDAAEFVEDGSITLEHFQPLTLIK